MRVNELNNITKSILSVEEIANILSITKESAIVSANRYVKNNLLIRLKTNLYITPEKFDKLNEEGIFKLANNIQVPSYISFTTALSYYNISTQQLQGIIESAALKRTKSAGAKTIRFNYMLLKKDFYNGFILYNDFFIASPEKAFADVIYLSSMSRYKCDLESIDFSKLNKQIISDLLVNTNNKAIKYWDNLCKRYKI